MISVTDLKSGTIFEDNGQIFQVLSYEHIKLGRGSANIKVKVKNVKTGSTTEKGFINGAKVNDLQIPKIELQFLYKDIDAAYFMNPQSFEQITIPLSKISSEHQFLKTGENYTISFLKDEPLAINLPPKMDLEVIETGPGVKGNSATNIFKDAVLENGIKTKVPLFINVGSKVRIDTRTGEYTEKA
ncbi:MAG: elongation factor P [Candidatus Levybacteria bacterium]|nr:elongation factor P [Candidatus Levybacteria bacterium]